MRSETLLRCLACGLAMCTLITLSAPIAKFAWAGPGSGAASEHVAMMSGHGVGGRGYQR